MYAARFIATWRGIGAMFALTDAALNNQALVHGDRLVSSYKDRHEKPSWIITEADRSYTTVLLPSDY